MTTLNSTYFRAIDRANAVKPVEAPECAESETLVDAVAVARVTGLILAVVALAAAFA